MQPAPSGDAALGLWHGCPWPPQCLGLGWGHSISLGDLELAPCLLHQAVPSARRWHWLWLPDQSSMARRSRAWHGTAQQGTAWPVWTAQQTSQSWEAAGGKHAS